MFSSIGNDWHLLGDVQYEKLELYSEMDWNKESNKFRLDQYVVAAGRNGGPIALVPDESLSLKQGGGTKLNPSLRIFSSSGRSFAEVPWETNPMSGGKLIKIGWTENELLVTIRELGFVRIRDIRGNVLREVRLSVPGSDPISQNGPNSITHGVIWSDGIVAITADLKVIAIRGVIALKSTTQVEPQVFSLMSAPLRHRRPTAVVTAIAVLEPEFSSSGLLRTIIALADSEIWIISELNANQVILPEEILSPALNLTVAPGGRFVSYFSAGGVLSVLKDDLTSQVMEFDTSSLEPPRQIVWCGQDCVLLHWPKAGILMVGPSGDWTKLHYDASNPLVLVPEIDCCRIITSSKLELLQRVPESTENISRIGSTDPAAMLFDAMEAFEDGDPKADDHIRAMARGDDPYAIQLSKDPITPTNAVVSGASGGSPGPSSPLTEGDEASDEGASGGLLVEAVNACIATAAAQFDVEKQKALLRAAAYGKGFLRGYDSEEFVACCRKIRVLNCLRSPEIGIPMTSDQYDVVGVQAIVERLVHRHLHLFALKVCKHLKIPPDIVVSSWASERLLSKDSADKTDEELRDMIRDRMYKESISSFRAIARTATFMGRRRLATMLLELEPFARDQVESLLDMGEEELALKRAVTSGDFDLVGLVLFSMDGKNTDIGGESSMKVPLERGQLSLFNAAYSYPESLSVLKAYYSSKEEIGMKVQLQNLCLFKNQFVDAGTLAVEAAYKQSRLEDRLSGLRDAEKVFANSRDLGFQQTITHDQVELLLAQRDLEISTGLKTGTFIDLSLSDTITRGIIFAGKNSNVELKNKENLVADILKLAKKFKVSEKHLWYLRVHALASSSQWSELQLLSTERRNPIGLGPFAKAALKYGKSFEEVDYYTDKIPQADERFELYMESKSWVKAAETAIKLKDPRRFAEVKSYIANNPTLSDEIDHLVVRGGFK